MKERLLVMPEKNVKIIKGIVLKMKECVLHPIKKMRNTDWDKISRHITELILVAYVLLPLVIIEFGKNQMIAAVILQSLLFSVIWRGNGLKRLSPKGLSEYVIYAIGGFGLLGILLYCFGIDIGYETGYTGELYMLLFALIYLSVKCRPVFITHYLDYLLGLLVIIQLSYLAYALAWPEMGGSIGRYVRDPESVALYAELGILIGCIRYVYTRGKREAYLYAGSTALCCLTLAINGEKLSLYLTVILLLIISIDSALQKESLKKSLQVFAAYLFLICNMPLLTEYTKLLQIECTSYSLEYSVILELLLCLLGYYLMGAWDKLNKLEKEQQLEQLKRIRKVLKQILTTIVILLLGVMFIGNRLSELTGDTIWSGMQAEAISIYTAVAAKAGSNAFYRGLSEYGSMGILLVLIFVLGGIECYRRRYKDIIQERRILNMLFMVIIISWGTQAAHKMCYGICLWILAYAMQQSLRFKTVGRGKGHARNEESDRTSK